MINAWGTSGNAGFAIPMASATPTLPESQAFILAWDPAQQLVAYVPVSIDATTGDITPAGNLKLETGKVVKVNGTQVVAARRTGWTADTGTALRTGFDTGTVTLAQLAGQVMALKEDLTAHGLIGS